MNNPHLVKLATVMDYFLKKDMSDADRKKLDQLLDEHGILRHPKSMEAKVQFHYDDAPQAASGGAKEMLNKALAHVKRNKGRYALGAAGLLGARYLYNKATEQPAQEMPPEQQAGF